MGITLKYDIWRELELFKKMHSGDNAYVNIYKGIREVMPLLEQHDANVKHLLLHFLDELLKNEPEDTNEKDAHLKEFLKKFDYALEKQTEDESKNNIKNFKDNLVELYAIVTNIEKNRDIVIKYIKHGAFGRPLTPLTDNEDEWTYNGIIDGDEVYINNRYNAVLKINGDVFWTMAELMIDITKEDGGWERTENSTELIELPSMIPETRFIYNNPETGISRVEYGPVVITEIMVGDDEGDEQ